MMGTDMGLNAQLDPMWHHVVLTARPVRNADLRHLAEAFANDAESVIFELRRLAAALDRPAEGWDEAVADFETDLGMDEASVELDEAQSRSLAVELSEASAGTFTARSRQLSYLPAQKDVA